MDHSKCHRVKGVSKSSSNKVNRLVEWSKFIKNKAFLLFHLHAKRDKCKVSAIQQETCCYQVQWSAPFTLFASQRTGNPVRLPTPAVICQNSKHSLAVEISTDTHAFCSKMHGLDGNADLLRQLQDWYKSQHNRTINESDKIQNSKEAAAKLRA